MYRVDLAWTDNAANEDGYLVYRRVQGDSTWSHLATLPANSTNYSDTTVLDDVTYEYKVTAYNRWNSSDSNTASAAIPLSTPTLDSLDVEGATITLTWTDKSNNEDGYEIERKLGAGTYAVVYTTAADVETWQDTGLAEASTYTYRLRAKKGTDYSSYSNELSATTGPAGPGNSLTATPNGLQVDLAWTDNSAGESGYSIERSTDGANFNELTTVAANSTSYSDTAVTAGQKYWYRVRAYITGPPLEYSDYSNIDDAMVLIAVPNLVATVIQ